MTTAQFEINNPEPGAMLFVARDPGTTEMRLNQPLVGRAGKQVFDPCLNEAGIRREKINIGNLVGTQPPGDDFARHSDAAIQQGLDTLYTTILKLQPGLIVAMGNEAAYALLPEWPTTRHAGGIKHASGIEDRRGYFWDSEFGLVLTTVHPAAALRNWVPWRMLLSFDFQRAKEVFERGLERPKREVIVV